MGHAMSMGTGVRAEAGVHGKSALKALPRHSRVLRTALRLASFQCVRPNGKALRAIRKAKNKSLQTLGTQAGINKAHLWRVEMGLAGISEQTLHRIAEALDEPVDAFTDEDKEMP